MKTLPLRPLKPILEHLHGLLLQESLLGSDRLGLVSLLDVILGVDLFPVDSQHGLNLLGPTWNIGS